MDAHPTRLDSGEQNLARAILLLAIQDLESKDEETVKAALDWLKDAHPDADFLDLILDECTGLSRDDIDAHIQRVFLKE